MGNYRVVLKGKSGLWWSAFVGWSLASLFATAWAINLVPYEPEWGDVGTWVAAILTGVGLFYAGLGLRHQVQQRQAEATQKKDDEQELRLAHARSVAIASNVIYFREFYDPASETFEYEVWRISYELVNTTGYPIDSVVVLTPLADGSNGFEEMVIGTVLPGRSFSGWSHEILRVSPPTSGLVDVCLVDFTDQWGAAWRRGPSFLERRESSARTC